MFGWPGETTVLQTGLDAVLDAPPWPTQLLLVTVGVLSALVAYRLADPGGRWTRRLRSRLLLGVPWGTILTGSFLLGMFLIIQGAYSGDIFDPRQPVTYAFVAWSYEYPLGVLTAPFSHGGFSHLLGNLIALAVFGSIAEYGYSHFRPGRGVQIEYASRQSPYVRPLGFVGAVVLVGIATSAFVPGPIIGFSGVVYALAGFALVVRPLTTVVGLLLTDVLRDLYSAFTSPVATYSPSVRHVDVWFADISVTGHLLGFLIGVLLGIVLWRRREERPRAARIWFAAVLFGLVQRLWLAYAPLGNGRYALFRGVGVAFVFLLAAAVVGAAIWPSRPSIPWPSRIPERLAEEAPSRGQAAAGVLVMIVLSLSLVGVVTHLQTVESTELPNDPVEVRDYQVGYSENVTNQLYSVVDIPGLQQVTSVDSSGVIVYSERRNVWQLAASKSRLASNGYARVTVGGVGWRETVGVTRTGWSVVGGSETYRVRLHPPDEPARLAFASDPATAEAIIANRSITLRPAGTDFEVVVDRANETLGVATLPESGANTTVGEIRFEREGRNLYASYDGTRVRVANKKVPPTRRD
ncbi:rhomboid family intramembrane serine protease [Halapricum hydrolyticum]|uniref:Rhomboid family intramembrane serine protease n=1 Tax=Halapricum hydrolyticum TaxID=2979991 RepID=A0AAE3IBB1_9EURY|nr:rhomboid family intramembrane serine protease [Halapricum hydrolyticum]MCU4717096.1 rhomboid family intramembrane serine protease [Halapricum hydrolyticum]MCU4726023.1 rhomboid family intramembrane serine protease [Halapricum hydrolyticum]